MINSKDFVKRLEKILDYYSFSATAFAEKIDFNRSTISHLLSGRNKPSLEFVMKLLKEFPEVEMNWLLFGKGSFPASIANISEKETVQKKSPNREEKSLDLFSETVKTSKPENIISSDKSFLNKASETEIEKIVIFYRDGSFKLYQN